MLKSEAEVETEVVVSDINITPFFWHWHWNTRLCPNPFTLLFSSYFQKRRFFVVTVGNRETKYYKLALMEK